MLIELPRDERGAALATVMLISMLIGALAALALNTSDQAQRSSARDRNHEIALGVAEAGIHRAISVINDHTTHAVLDDCLGDEGYVFGDWCPGEDGESFDTPQGSYTFWYKRTHQGFEIASHGASGGASLGRSRQIHVEVLPPPLFPDAKFALFSDSSITLNNNNEVLEGDVWARRSVTLPNNSELHGSVTAWERWIELKNGAKVHGDASAGGYNEAPSQQSACKPPQHAADWAICNEGEIMGQVSVPGDPDCDPTDAEATVRGSGTFDATTITCASPPGPDQSIPEFTYDPSNYDSDTLMEFSSVGAFMTWLDGNESGLSGTFYIEEPNPSQNCKPNQDRAACKRIDLSGVVLGGDTTIITEAPIFAHGLDVLGGETRTFVAVSFYEQPISTACEVNKDDSDCAIHFKNNFVAGNADCSAISLLYANKGPIALKNNPNSGGPDMCGSAIGAGILTQNNQKFQYADEIDRVLGFHAGSFEIARWVECPPVEEPEACW